MKTMTMYFHEKTLELSSENMADIKLRKKNITRVIMET